MSNPSPFQPVGQAPVHTHHTEITAVVTCTCSPKVPLVIRGLDALALCAKCQRRFSIAAVTFNRQEHTFQTEIGVEQPTIVRPA